MDSDDGEGVQIGFIILLIAVIAGGWLIYNETKTSRKKQKKKSDVGEKEDE
jgi:ABC-type Na+ efflux pump permease subunit